MDTGKNHYLKNILRFYAADYSRPRLSCPLSALPLPATYQKSKRGTVSRRYLVYLSGTSYELLVQKSISAPIITKTKAPIL